MQLSSFQLNEEVQVQSSTKESPSQCIHGSNACSNRSCLRRSASLLSCVEEALQTEAQCRLVREGSKHFPKCTTSRGKLYSLRSFSQTFQEENRATCFHQVNKVSLCLTYVVGKSEIILTIIAIQWKRMLDNFTCVQFRIIKVWRQVRINICQNWS